MHIYILSLPDLGRITWPLLLSPSKMLEMWEPKAMIKIRIREQSAPVTFSDCTVPKAFFESRQFGNPF